MMVKNIYFTTDSISNNNESGRGANLSIIRSKQRMVSGFILEGTCRPMVLRIEGKVILLTNISREHSSEVKRRLI
jgi:hypothetical protein